MGKSDYQRKTWIEESEERSEANAIRMNSILLQPSRAEAVAGKGDFHAGATVNISVQEMVKQLKEKIMNRTRCDADRMRKLYGIFNDDGGGGGSSRGGIDKDEFVLGMRYGLGINV